MDSVNCTITVFFDEPFWVMVYERASGKMLEAARVVFGAEPKDYVVYEYLLKNWGSMIFSPPVIQCVRLEKKSETRLARYF